MSWSSAELREVNGAADDNNDAVTVSSAATSPRLMPAVLDGVPAPPRRVHWSASVGSTTDSAVDDEEVAESVPDEGEFANQDDLLEEDQPLTIFTDPCVFIQPPSRSDRWYVVVKGWRIGVFDDW